MDQRTVIIIQRFDLRKPRGRCNHVECEKPSSKRVIVFESDNVTSEKRELVLLNLCSRHAGEINGFLEELRGMTVPSKTIGAEVFETGYITC